MKPLAKPNVLQHGDKVATISLSWGGTSGLLERYNQGKNSLETIFGLNVVETKHALRSAEWLYKNPRAKAEDLMEAFSDKSIKAIFTNIGGDDSIRTLSYMDLDIIKSNPKIFFGFSDTTISHFVCFKAGLSSFYGTSLMVGFAEYGGMHPYQIADINRTLFSSTPVGQVLPNKGGWTSEPIEWFNPSLLNTKRKLTPNKEWNFLQGSGKVQGRLIGGCMEVLELLKATDYWPEREAWKDCILFLEISDETLKPDRFCAWLRNYAAQGILRNVKGILVGRPNDNAFVKEYNDELLKVMREEELTNLPIVTEMDFGHTCPIFTLPFGATSEIDCDKKTFSILESGVVG
jgi:muramoyltetrapeptide carboxypeptidase LdcA involved in peptidoglycan recycling